MILAERFEVEPEITVKPLIGSTLFYLALLVNLRCGNLKKNVANF